MVAIALFPGDSALLLLLLVVGAFVVLGMITDGLRMAMLFAGTVVAYLLAPLLRNYIPRSFLPDNPLWQDMGVGSIYSFILLMILFFIGFHYLHRWIEIELKYKMEPRKHEQWWRVNSVIGLSLGGIIGVIYFLMIAGKITPLGYVTAQMQPANPSADPVGYRLTARLYKDFHTLGVDKTARMFDPASSDYYAAADVAGIIYNNCGTTNTLHISQFRARLLGYPGLVDAAYNQHVMQLTHLHQENLFFMGLYYRTNLTHLLANQTLQSAMGDTNLQMQLAQVDMNDLQEFLLDGRSKQYTSAALAQQNRPRILGRWILDVNNTLQQFHIQYEEKFKTTMPDRARHHLEKYIEAIGDQMSLSFSDGYVYLEARHFHNRALARNSNNFIPKTTDISPNIIRSSSLELKGHGEWNNEDSSRFRSELFYLRDLVTRQFDVACPILIESYSSMIMITLEGFNNEKYVFRRQKF